MGVEQFYPAEILRSWITRYPDIENPAPAKDSYWAIHRFSSLVQFTTTWYGREAGESAPNDYAHQEALAIERTRASSWWASATGRAKRGAWNFFIAGSWQARRGRAERRSRRLWARWAAPRSVR